MKNLLITVITLLSSGNLLPTMPKQNIFTDNYAYECVNIDMNKLAIAESILWPKGESLVLAERKEGFYNQLVELYDNNKLTQKSLLATLQKYEMYNYTNDSHELIIDEIHIPELLKEQKNRLIRTNHLLVRYRDLAIEESPAFNYVMVALYGTLGTLCFSADKMDNPQTLTQLEDLHPIFYICAAVTLASLAKVYSIYRTVRDREAEMDKINKMISAIEVVK